MVDTKQPHVFLCHASEDKPAVRRLYKRLTKDGIDAWLDKEKLLPGQDWQLEISKAIKVSAAIIVLLSSQSVKKAGFVQKEIKLALDVAKEKPEGTIYVIPARLDKCTIPDLLQSYEWVDLFDHKGYERIKKALQTHLNLPQIEIPAYSDKITELAEVTIIIERDFLKFTDKEKSKFVRDIAKLARVSTNQIRILYVAEGSVIITVEMPEIGAKRLLELYYTDSTKINSLQIRKITIGPENEKKNVPQLVESYVIENRKKSGSSQDTGLRRASITNIHAPPAPLSINEFMAIPTGKTLKVFISSKMAELRDVREIITKALTDRAIEAVVYETSKGAQPENVLSSSLRAVEESDIYIGLFWKEYGPVTIKEYRHARSLKKPCFIYIRDKDVQRDPQLQNFLNDEVYDMSKGVTYDYFNGALALGEAIGRDIFGWMTRRVRDLDAQVKAKDVSREEIDRLQAEVKRLQWLSREALPQDEPVDDLARQLREWLQAANYSMEGNVVRNGEYADLILNLPRDRRGYDRILVRILAREVKVNDVRELRGIVDERKFNGGWLVSELRITPAAHQAAEDDARGDLWVGNLEAVIDRDVDFTHYFEWLENEVKSKHIEKYFVPLAGQTEDLSSEGESIGTSTYSNVEEYLDRWLDATDKEHVSILGEFGTGKTWSALHYAYQLMREYQAKKTADRKRPRIPLVIQLRNYAQGFKDVDSLLSEFVFREHEIGLPGYSAFEWLNKMGRLLLIFDGFDEMVARVDWQKMVDNFWEIAKVVVPGSKVILTCRTEYFHYARQEREVLGGEIKASTTNILLESPKFEVLHFVPLGNEQIRSVLRRRADETVVEIIMGNQELVDLANRPLLSEFILEALPEVRAGKPVDMAHIYYYAAQRKMERDIAKGSTFTSLADKLYFLCELSWEMLSTDQMSLSYKLFPDRIRQYFGPKVDDVEQDHWHYDLLSQTMLHRDAEGNYSPAHRSLLEFFVAYKFAAELGALRPEFTEAARQQLQIRHGSAAEDYSWSTYFRRDRDENGEIALMPPLRFFIPDSIEQLSNTVGKQPFTKAILHLMQGMVDNVESLWGIIESTRGKSGPEVGYAGANAATLLNLLRIPFRGRNLSGAVLQKADLTRCDLTGADLSGAVLREATLREALLGDAVLANADMTDANLGGVQLFRMGMVDALDFSKDGLFLASGSKEGVIRVWNVKSGEQEFALFGHSAWVASIAYSPNGKLIARGSGDTTVTVWDVATRQEVLVLAKHGDNVNRVCFTPDGLHLISVSSDQTIRIWDLDTGSQVQVIEGHESVIRGVAVSPDGRYFATGGWDHTIKVWNFETGKLTVTLEDHHKDYVRSVAYSPDGKYLVSASNDFTAIIWDSHASKSIHILEHPDVASSAVFSPDSKYVATASWDDRTGVRIWDRASGTILFTLTGHADGALAVNWSPDGRLLASGGRDNTIRLWDTVTGECLRVINQKLVCNGLNLHGVRGLVSDDIKWLKSFGAID